MSKRQKRPSWFKLFLSCKSVFDAVPDEVAGRAIKVGFRYFETGEVDAMDSLTGVVFAALKPSIDEAVADFQRSVDTGRAGGKKRWGKEVEDRPPIGPLTTPIGESTEDRREKIEDRRKKIEDRGQKKEERGREEDTAAAPPRTPYGKFQNVFLSSGEVAELEATIPEWHELVNRLSVYMESTGKAYKNHYATLISWYQQDNQKPRETDKVLPPIPGVPTL